MNVCPGLFEEFIDITELKFYVKKISDNKYLSFAYNELKILNAIKNSGISIGQISNIYFGQIELQNMIQTDEQVCMKIDNVCLSFINNILVQIPASLKVEISNNTNIQHLELSKDKIYINSGSKYMDTKTTYLLSLLFILFSLFTFSKVIHNNNTSTVVPKKIEKIKQQLNMPATLVQTKSIISKIKKTVKKQSNIREIFDYLFNVKKSIGGTMIEVDFKNNNFIIKFKDIDAKKLTAYLEKKYSLSSAVVKNGIVTIGLKYEN